MTIAAANTAFSVNQEAAIAASSPESIHESETYEQLLAMAGKRFHPLPADYLVRHVMAVTPMGNWPVRRAALEALQTRQANLLRDQLQVTGAVRAKRPHAEFKVSRPGRKGQSYRVLLRGVCPLDAACSCPDFVRNSLGVCKHILAVLRAKCEDRGEEIFNAAAPEDRVPTPGLLWNPIRPLCGAYDLLSGFEWRGSADSCPTGARFLLRKFFTKKSDDSLSLADKALAVSARRGVLLKTLRALLDPSQGSPSDPAAEVVLATEEARQALRTRSRKALETLSAALKSFKQKLYPYQIEGVRRFLENGRLLLADDMGLGKTMQAIAACHALWQAHLVRRGLLIVPAALKSQWLREWQRATDLPVVIVEGTQRERLQIYRRHERGFLIANYEQVWRDLEEMHHWQPDLVVLDEAQRIKNWSTKTAQYVKQLQPQFRLVLTGTPMENRIDELVSIVDWVDSFALQPVWRINAQHLVLIDGRSEVGGLRDLGLLRARLDPCLLRRLRTDVLKQLPKRSDTVIPVPLSDAQKGAHADYDQPIVQLMAIAKKHPLTQAQFLRLMSYFTSQRIICNGIEQYQFDDHWPELSQVRNPREDFLASLNSPKLAEFYRVIRSIVIEQGRKAVVFSQWRHMLILAQWAVSGLLAEHGVRAVFFTGQESQKRRTHNIVDFHDDPSARIFFATDAGGVGLNLQHAANCCINLDLPWNPAVLEQRIGRIYRLGQKHPIDVYNLVAETGIEARISTIVANKRAMFKGIFDGGSDQVEFEHQGSFLERMARIIEPVDIPKLGAVAAQSEDENCMEEVTDLEHEASAEVSVEAPVGASLGGGSSPVPLSEAPARVLAPVAAALPPSEAAETPAPSIAALFSQVTVQRREDGGITLQAPPQAAAQLAGAFDVLAQLLRAAGQVSSGGSLPQSTSPLRN